MHFDLGYCAVGEQTTKLFQIVNDGMARLPSSAHLKLTRVYCMLFFRGSRCRVYVEVRKCVQHPTCSWRLARRPIAGYGRYILLEGALPWLCPSPFSLTDPDGIILPAVGSIRLRVQRQMYVH